MTSILRTSLIKVKSSSFKSLSEPLKQPIYIWTEGDSIRAKVYNPFALAMEVRQIGREVTDTVFRTICREGSDLIFERERMKLTKQTLFLSLMIIQQACRPEFRVKNETDPFLQAFWGKGISSMTEKYCKVDSCTSFHPFWKVSTFDRHGNIILEQHLIDGNPSHDFDRFAYDEQHALTRHLLVSDTYGNALYAYRLDDSRRILYRFNYSVPTREWDFGKTRVDSLLVDTVEYRLDRKGRVLTETDLRRESTTRYFYDGGLLMRKQTLPKDNWNVETWNYHYSEGQIRQIDHLILFDTIRYGCDKTSYFYSKEGNLVYAKVTPTNSPPRYMKYFFTYYDSTDSAKK